MARPSLVSAVSASESSSTITTTTSSSASSSLTIIRPDDWHLHLRDGPLMASVLHHSAHVFGRAIIMPNLLPPITTVRSAEAYRQRILDVLSRGEGSPEEGGTTEGGVKEATFQPLMTLYLTDNTTALEVEEAIASGFVHAFKLYPAGATTNSDSGVTDVLGKALPALEALAEHGMPLLVHGEVTDPLVDIFDREKEFIQRVLTPLLQKIPSLRVVMEHITTEDAAQFVLSHPTDNVAATITPHHLLMNRNALFQGGIRPHHYCLPVLKRNTHRLALLKAVASGSPRLFLGTDSAPHPKTAKESSCGCAGIFNAHAALPLYAQAFEEAGALHHLEAFASLNGPRFYRLPPNTGTVTLSKSNGPWKVPEEYVFGEHKMVPMCAGELLTWRVESCT